MKNGIISAGNWIIDRVKIIDKLPERGNLGNIKDEILGNGGCPYNVLKDLTKMNVHFPLYAVGIIGDDENGDLILNDLKENNIDTQYLNKTQDAPTSYTDVMTDETTGDRTFYHCRGANALLDFPHFENIETNAKIFHLGYLLLLDKLDAADEKYGVVAAKVLNLLIKKGYKISVDVVSEQSDRFKRIVEPCLKFIDYLIINEFEASQITGLTIRKKDNSIDGENLMKSTEILLNNGVKELVVIHFPEGGYAMKKSGEKLFVPSFLVENTEIKGSVGAGDAFCAGILYALHEGFELEKMIKFANANARFNLLSPTSSDGAVSVKEVENYMNTAQLRKTII